MVKTKNVHHMKKKTENRVMYPTCWWRPASNAMGKEWVPVQSQCEVMRRAASFGCWESKLVSRQVEPPKTECKHSLFSSQEGKDDYLTITRPQRREKPHCLSDRKRDYRVAAVLMMMGKVKNTAVSLGEYTKLPQLAGICGTWLTHWQCSSK